MYAQIIRFQLKHVSEEEYVVLSNDLSSNFVGVPWLISKVWLADSSTGTWGVDSPVTMSRDLANLTPADCAVMEESTVVARGLVGANRDRPCLLYRRRVIFQQGGAR